MKFKNILSILAILLVGFIVGANYFYSYSQYSSIISGTSSARIANAKIVLKQGKSGYETEIIESQTLIFERISPNAYTAVNRFAPTTKMQAILTLDFSQVEVSVDYMITADVESFTSKFGSNAITLTMTENSASGTAIRFGELICCPLKTFISNPAKAIKKYFFTLNWTSDTAESVDNTNLALNYDTLNLPIVLRVTQHIENHV